MSEPTPNRRIQIVAVGFAAAALATAVIAVVVVATRSAPELPSPPPSNVVEDRDVAAGDVLKLDKDYGSKVWSMGPDGLAVDDAALRKALGLDARDVITALSGRTLKRDHDVQRAVFDLSILEARTVYVEVMRDHRAVLYRWKIDGDLREARHAKSAALLGGSGSTWAPLGGSGSATVDPLAPPPPPDPVNPFAASVKVIDDTHLEVPQSMADAFFVDVGAFSHDLRVVPAMTNGHPNGFKLYAIRPTSLVAALHFKNGDTVVSINGEDLSASGSQSLAVYTRLKSSKQFVIDMIRRGSPMTLTIDIK